MRISDLGIVAIVAAFGVLAGWAFVVKPKAARICLWLSAVAYGFIGVIWSVAHPAYPMLTRLGVAGIIGAVAAVGLVLLLDQLPHEHNHMAQNNKAPPTAETATLDEIPTEVVHQGGAIGMLNNIEIHGFKHGAALFADGKTVITVDNSKIHDNEVGLKLRDGARANVKDSDISHNQIGIDAAGNEPTKPPK